MRANPTMKSYAKVVTFPFYTKVKKGCGQRKNKRNRAGRRRHEQMLPYGHQHKLALAS